MDMLEIMKKEEAYCSDHRDMPGDHRDMPGELQKKAKMLCWRYNQTSPEEGDVRAEILRELLGTCHPLTFIEPSFRCDYGFNIHTHGLTVINYNCVILDTSPVHIGENAFIAPGVCIACSGFRCDYGFNIHTHGLTVINYNCVILDTSPVHIGENAFIAPGVCIACSGHSKDAAQRAAGIGTSAPVTIGRDVWIGANSTVCGGVSIGDGTIIGTSGSEPIPLSAAAFPSGTGPSSGLEAWSRRISHPG